MTNNKRIEMLDALRGFALLGIVLIHSITHFNIFGNNHLAPQFLAGVDTWVYQIIMLLTDGKCYSLFSILLGYSFWIQYSRKQNQGIDFGGRYLWRLFLLFLIGMLHSFFYSGDILVLYAVTGVIVVLTRKLSNRIILAISFILLTEPLGLFKIISLLTTGEMGIPQINIGKIFGPGMQVLMTGSLLEVLVANIKHGLLANNAYNWEFGRVTQAPGLFLIGVWLCRTRLLLNTKISKWKIAFVVSLIVFTLIKLFNPSIIGLVKTESIKGPMGSIIANYTNLIGTISLLSLFIILWSLPGSQKVLSKLTIYGRMSLTNYFMQGVLGALFFYGFGFGLYIYAGATISALIGIGIFIIQLKFSQFHLKHFKQGPFEKVWRDLTNIEFKKETLIPVILRNNKN